MVKNQRAFWILPSFTLEIVKSQMEEKQRKTLKCRKFKNKILVRTHRRMLLNNDQFFQSYTIKIDTL